MFQPVMPDQCACDHCVFPANGSGFCAACWVTCYDRGYADCPVLDELIDAGTVDLKEIPMTTNGACGDDCGTTITGTDYHCPVCHGRNSRTTCPHLPFARCNACDDRSLDELLAGIPVWIPAQKGTSC